MINSEIENGVPTSWEIGELDVDGERIIYPGLTEEELRSTMMYNLHLAASNGAGYLPIRTRDPGRRPSLSLIMQRNKIST
ncbi:hypothetical protein A8L34_00620 [Bacillus sp. FJAT-27264]|uniref:hypothetical protein n=1 Tax=Paenibacillus sp. (strain DSM 101736 / FJAT-27264) TaxID=1850362 RepID=UPI000807FEB3|nr:hypothetical protein [Bacillus sp. FJAT-27264]OBZ18125.1 hypothetical protein A8L34_00620 [Bacillus sp. FJAT-27264]